jgi:C4-type Zn-finger protein
LPQNDNNAGAGRCPVCKGLGPFAPEEAEYRGKGVIHHHWQCASCGHDWVTIMHVLV